jgi:hypothetical protein
MKFLKEQINQGLLITQSIKHIDFKVNGMDALLLPSKCIFPKSLVGVIGACSKLVNKQIVWEGVGW